MREYEEDESFENAAEDEEEDNIHDRHVQLRALYRVLLKRQSEFDEFRMMLASYPRLLGEAQEPMHATALREIATARAREWTGMPIERFSPKQMELWRNLLIEDRDNVAISPWRESNMY